MRNLPSHFNQHADQQTLRGTSEGSTSTAQKSANPIPAAIPTRNSEEVPLADLVKVCCATTSSIDGIFARQLFWVWKKKTDHTEGNGVRVADIDIALAGRAWWPWGFSRVFLHQSALCCLRRLTTASSRLLTTACDTCEHLRQITEISPAAPQRQTHPVCEVCTLVCHIVALHS